MTKRKYCYEFTERRQYKCCECGRTMYEPTAHYCNGEFRKHNLEFITKQTDMNERFDPKTFKPFDKVLARCTESEWMPTLFGFLIDTDNKDPFSPFVLGERVVCVDVGYQQCIPYNDETKHLVGTLDDCPEYYKWWEE